MKFWDSSALVPLIAEQAATPQIEQWFRADPGVVVWALAETEIRSAIWRLAREGTIDEDQALACEQLAEDLLRTAHVVCDLGPVAKEARRLLRVHPLRAADALQLGAALCWADGDCEGKTFCSLDDRLCIAARKEGFTIARGTTIASQP